MNANNNTWPIGLNSTVLGKRYIGEAGGVHPWPWSNQFLQQSTGEDGGEVKCNNCVPSTNNNTEPVGPNWKRYIGIGEAGGWMMQLIWLRCQLSLASMTISGSFERGIKFFTTINGRGREWRYHRIKSVLQKVCCTEVRINFERFSFPWILEAWGRKMQYNP